MDRFAAEFTFLKRDDSYTCYGGKLVSTIPDLTAKSNGIEPDIFNPLVLEDERMKVLEDGVYQVFILGDVLHDSDSNEYIFSAAEKDVVFIALAVKPKVVSNVRQNS